MGDELLMQRLLAAMDHAEKEAWNAMARYKFHMFGYWSAEWVKLKRLADVNRPNPFSSLVQHARGLGYGPDVGSVESLEAASLPPSLPALLAAMEQEGDRAA